MPLLCNCRPSFRLFSFLFSAAALLLSGPSALAAGLVSPKNEGVLVHADGAAKFNLKYPDLLNQANKTEGKLIEAALAGTKAHLKYDNGAEAEVTAAGESMTIQFSHVPGTVKSFRMESNLGFGFIGAQWKVNNNAFQPFPEAKPVKPHLFQGTCQSFSIQNFTGKTLKMQFGSTPFFQLTDCREWNWKNFKLSISFAMKPGTPCKISFSEAGTAGQDAGKALVDQFGQYALKDWPDKVKSEGELKSDVAAEKEYYSSLHPPQLDRFGGLPGSKEKYGFQQTGFFHVEKKGDRWYLVNPDGNWMFYLGVCAIATYINNVEYPGQELKYEWLPSSDGEYFTAFGQNGDGKKDGKFNFYIANRIRKYGTPHNPKSFSAEMIQRIRSFGFNAGGAFGAGESTARTEANFPFMQEMPLRSWQGIPHLAGLRETWDPFDQKTLELVDRNLSKLNSGDPLLIGRYLVNEPLYEDIPRVVPTYNESKACKRRLVQMLEEKYHTIDAFNQAWNTQLASFADAAQQGLPVKTKQASDDMEEFKNLFLETYFKYTCETVRKYDPNHMLIGCRLQSGTINSESLCRIGAKYMDAWSFNYYTYGLDEKFLTRIHQWTGGKPMILSEFHFNSSADSGVTGGAKDVKSQEERGLAYRHYVEQAANLPYIVGIEWYTLIDGAVSGFNANCGLINVVDRPWKKMIAEMVKTNYGIYQVASGERPRFVYNDPRFSGKGEMKRTLAAEFVRNSMEIDGQSGDWPGVPAERIGTDRVTSGNAVEGFEAALKVCWSKEFLYLFADVTDPTPMLNEHPGPHFWEGDALEVFTGSEELDRGGPLIFGDRHLILSAAKEGDRHYYVNAPEQYACSVAVTPKAGGNGYYLEAGIPWSALSIKPESNREILFDLGVDGSADGKRRDLQLMWNGTAKNSGDRTNWGRLRLVGQ